MKHGTEVVNKNMIKIREVADELRKDERKLDSLDEKRYLLKRTIFEHTDRCIKDITVINLIG